MLARELIHTVRDFQDERFQIVQEAFNVDNLNEQYGTDYQYFFYEYESGDTDYPVALWGSYGHNLHNDVEFISQYI